MALRFENQIADDLSDDVGRCLQTLHAYPTWTAAKVSAFKDLEELTAREGYLRFTGDFRSYHLERKGESCLYDIPMTQRGALQPFRGQRVRLICAGGMGSLRRSLLSCEGCRPALEPNRSTLSPTNPKPCIPIRTNRCTTLPVHTATRHSRSTNPDMPTSLAKFAIGISRVTPSSRPMIIASGQ